VYDVNRGLPVLLDDATRKYVWGLGLAYAVDSGGAISVYHSDGLGSARALSDASGAVIATYETDEFGVPTATQGASTQPFQYTGEQRDPETGFVYLRARMYDASVGRFAQRDRSHGLTALPVSLNNFTYAHSNPPSLVDPSGFGSQTPTVAPSPAPRPQTPIPTWTPTTTTAHQPPEQPSTVASLLPGEVIERRENWYKVRLTNGVTFEVFECVQGPRLAVLNALQGAWAAVVHPGQIWSRYKLPHGKPLYLHEVGHIAQFGIFVTAGGQSLYFPMYIGGIVLSPFDPSRLGPFERQANILAGLPPDWHPTEADREPCN
jgi:RHS repeat-associated protein